MQQQLAAVFYESMVVHRSNRPLSGCSRVEKDTALPLSRSSRLYYTNVDLKNTYKKYRDSHPKEKSRQRSASKTLTDSFRQQPFPNRPIADFRSARPTSHVKRQNSPTAKLPIKCGTTIHSGRISLPRILKLSGSISARDLHACPGTSSARGPPPPARSIESPAGRVPTRGPPLSRPGPEPSPSRRLDTFRRTGIRGERSARRIRLTNHRVHPDGAPPSTRLPRATFCVTCLPHLRFEARVARMNRHRSVSPTVFLFIVRRDYVKRKIAHGNILAGPGRQSRLRPSH
ncbi:hypothetical protein EVAR_88693_1 [Eumeta japonica]|uniref:Uncharacterized protein n=1 Tax=Eumeta variegata TaxID=151549 RepID=A0A4C1Y147_EUMVA|nr:hypothetical protein EVAR_88693_1 [Eumeta japonica]